MLSVKENETLTRTGPGTPMGDLFRRFWLPVMLETELGEPDGAPVRLKILSESLVAFRDTNGNVGLFDERCPHMRASLYWGRNEEAGLRCPYHSWKFTTDGTCVDQPYELEGNHFKDQGRATAYRVHEAGGVIWAYLGPREHEPPFPDFEFTLVPRDHVTVHKRLQRCNYLQGLEAEIDTAHGNPPYRSSEEELSTMPPERARARYLISEANFGLLCLERSDSGPDDYSWRMTPYHLPTFTIPATRTNVWLAAVPIDDETMYGFVARWNHDRPITEEDTVERGASLVEAREMAVREDRDGPMMRREEHLGINDRPIGRARRLLLRLAENLEIGIEPPQAHHPESFRLRAVGVTARREVDPLELWSQGQPAPVDIDAFGVIEEW